MNFLNNLNRKLEIMPASNIENYTTEELFLAEFGRAIAHPARARMLFLLMKNGTFRNVDFTKANKVSTSTTHNHLYKMKEADLIHMEYTNHEYHAILNTDVLELAVKLLHQAFDQTPTIKELVQELELEKF